MSPVFLAHAAMQPRVVGDEVGDLWGDISHVASDAVNTFNHAVSAVTDPHGVFGALTGPLGHVLAPVADFAKNLASNAIGAISLIPGIGTGVAAAVSAGLAILEGGQPLDVAIKTAYGAIPIPPGVKQFTDIVVDAILQLLHSGGNVAHAVIATIKEETMKRLPDFARGVGGQVFDTLAHLFVTALTGKPTIAVTTKKVLPHVAQTIAHSFAAGHKLPPHVKPLPPTAKHHLALHLVPAAKAAQLAAVYHGPVWAQRHV